MILEGLKKISYKVFSGRCVLCGVKSARTLDLCIECESSLAYFPRSSCVHCGIPIASASIFDENQELICGKCLRRAPIIRRLLAVLVYAEPVKSLLLRLKFTNKLIYSNIFANLLCSRLSLYYKSRSWPQLIIPMPLYKQRLKERGFNQALEIIRPVAQRLKLNLAAATLVSRVKHTAPQASLAEHKRRANVSGAFQINKKELKQLQLTKLLHVAIFDDVVTTGSTVKELARTLRRAGIKTIDVWCVAKTIKNHS